MSNLPRRQFCIILSIVFFGFLGLSMPYLIFPSLFLNPNYSIITSEWSAGTRGVFLGITLAAYPLGQFLGSPMLGSLSDAHGRRKLMSGSLLITAIFSLLTALAIVKRSLWLLILSRFITGFMEGNLAIARAMAADIKQYSKHKTFGMINASASIAYLMGPLFGGLLSDQHINQYFSLSTPFYVICLLYLTLSGLSFFGLKEIARSIPAIKRTVWERINIIRRLNVLFRNRTLKFLLIIISTFTLAVDIFYEFGPVYLTELWLLSPAKLGVYNAMLCITLAIGNGWLAALLTRYFSNRKIVSISMLFFSVILIGMILIEQKAVMLFLFTLIGFCIALPVTNLTVQISDSVSDKNQGEVMGVIISLRVFGDALICLLGGVLLFITSKIVLALAVGFAIISGVCMASFKIKTTPLRIPG